MSILETLATEVIRRVFNRNRETNSTILWSEAALERHLIEVVRWSGRIDFFGLEAPRSTDESTVGLEAGVPRRFAGKSTGPTRNEQDLITASANTLILGDPGAGKTTTLKRLARIILQQPAISADDIAQFPIVVRLRELTAASLLEERILDAVNVVHERIVPEPPPKKVTASEPEEVSDNYKPFKVVVDGRNGLDVIAEAADLTGALFLLDGLDEVNQSIRGWTEATIIELGRKCGRARVIVTCRSGDYRHTIDGFDVVEIRPIDIAHADQIIDIWADDPAGFRTAVAASGVTDLMSRPLFLCELIVLFNRIEYLPVEPSEVIKRILLLALEAWDARKPLRRKSRYANFESEKKLRFLAALSYALTFGEQAKQFSSESLKNAYSAIREDFRLPAGQVDDVVAELETHTGIFVRVVADRFEFSHLSIQEYLAAYHLSRRQVGPDVVAQVLAAPAPVAISVALAADQTERLALILLARDPNRTLFEADLTSFLSRVLQERVPLRESKLLGFGAVGLLFSKTSEDVLDSFLSLEPVALSVAAALPAYLARTQGGGDEDPYQLRLREYFQVPYGVVLPGVGWVRPALLNTVLDKSSMKMETDPSSDNEDGSLGPLFFVKG